MLSKYYFCYSYNPKNIVIYNQTKSYIIANNVSQNTIEKARWSFLVDGNCIYIVYENKWNIEKVYDKIECIELNDIAEEKVYNNEWNYGNALTNSDININAILNTFWHLTFIAKELVLNYWRIDLLYKNDKGDFIVVELKKGELTFKDVDQTLRYVKELVDLYGQNTHWVLIWRECSEELYQYAKQNNITIKTI